MEEDAMLDLFWKATQSHHNVVPWTKMTAKDTNFRNNQPQGKSELNEKGEKKKKLMRKKEKLLISVQH